MNCLSLFHKLGCHKEQSEDLTAASFEEWAEDLKMRSLRTRSSGGWLDNEHRTDLRRSQNTGFFTLSSIKTGPFEEADSSLARAATTCPASR